MNLDLIANIARRPSISCTEKLQLRTIYGDALKRRDAAINDMVLARGKVSKEEYDRIRVLADEARAALVLADEARAALNRSRQALEQHKLDHGC